MKSDAKLSLLKLMDTVAESAAQLEGTTFMQKLVSFLEKRTGRCIRIMKGELPDEIASLSMMLGTEAGDVIIGVNEKFKDRNHLRFAVAHELSHLLLSGVSSAVSGETGERRVVPLTLVARGSDSESTAHDMTLIAIAYAGIFDGQDREPLETILGELGGSSKDEVRQLLTLVLRHINMIKSNKSIQDAE